MEQELDLKVFCITFLWLSKNKLAKPAIFGARTLQPYSSVPFPPAP